MRRSTRRTNRTAPRAIIISNCTIMRAHLMLEVTPMTTGAKTLSSSSYSSSASLPPEESPLVTEELRGRPHMTSTQKGKGGIEEIPQICVCIQRGGRGRVCQKIRKFC